jgi:hypothetical protein
MGGREKKISLDFGGLSGKAVDDMAVDTLTQGGFVFPPPPPPAPEPLSPEEAKAMGWALVSDGSVRHITDYPKQSLRLTEVFNFQTRTNHQICEELGKGTAHMNVQPFDTIDKARLAEAADVLRRLGGRTP